MQSRGGYRLLHHFPGAITGVTVRLVRDAAGACEVPAAQNSPAGPGKSRRRAGCSPQDRQREWRRAGARPALRSRRPQRQLSRHQTLSNSLLCRKPRLTAGRLSGRSCSERYHDHRLARVGLGARRVVPAAETQRRLRDQEAGLRRNPSRWARCAESRPSCGCPARSDLKDVYDLISGLSVC